MPIFIAKKITLKYAKRMRERILFLSILLFLPIYAYGSITPTCPSDSGLCDSTPGCKSMIGGCQACGPGEYCPGNGVIKTCTTEAGSDFEFSPDGSTAITDCYKKIDENNNYCEKENGENIGTCGLFYPNGTPKCWNANTGEYDENYHTEGNGTNIKCYSNIRNCKLFNKSGCDGPVSGRLKWSVDAYWTAIGTTYNCACEKKAVSYNSCIADVTYSLTDITPDTSANATITYAPSSYECKKCPAGKYLALSDFTSNSQCTGGNVACSCTDTDKGYYSTGCNINGVQSISSCQQTPCPKPGQTTNDVGAGTSVGDCHYSSETKFCDAAGCFTISDAGNNNVWNWNY